MFIRDLPCGQKNTYAFQIVIILHKNEATQGNGLKSWEK
jgi:hypothetical protein